MKNLFSFFLFLISTYSLTFAQTYKIIESDNQHIKIELNFENTYHLKDTLIDTHIYQIIYGGKPSFRNPGEPWIPDFTVNLGIPFNSKPILDLLKVDKAVYENKYVLPYPKEDPSITRIDINRFDKKIYSSNEPFPNKPAELGIDYIMRYSRVIPLTVSPYQYNPISHQLIYYKKMTVLINYNINTSTGYAINDKFTKDFLRSGVINYSQALQWMEKKPVDITYGGMGYGNYWYDPNKNYFKIYLKRDGVYRITFEQLVAAGVPIQSGVESNKLELVNEGNSIPINVEDGGDGIFNSGDYFQFVGGPPSPTPNSRLNIYNNTNVYWFSYQSDTLAARYSSVDGYPINYQATIQSTLENVHYEKDSLYEQLGHSGTLNIDHWYWDKVSGNHGLPTHIFNSYFPTPENFNADEHYLKVTANLTGMNDLSCTPDNHVQFNLNGYIMGDLSWNHQSNATYERTLYISQDSVHLYPDSNFFQIRTIESSSCDTTNECRINWFDVQYYRYNRTNGNNFIFHSSPNSNGIIRFQVWLWNEDNMKIYIPSKNKLISNPQFLNDSFRSVLFVDTVSQITGYYCVDSNYSLSIDSIKGDVGSNLRSPSNGADYIIITHPDFMDAAQRLKNLRTVHYPDSEITNPRIQIVDVNQIYDEFSYGLLDPKALQDFVKYAFENWTIPAPVYIVLFGDMSHDYRHLLTTSRKDFIPSMPFYANEYGEAPSDNLIVEVAGNDLAPDLAIGRMSCETTEEADVLMDKLENYPEDNTKPWKQDVLLASSGLYLEDEMQMHFNEANNRLANLYLIPNGIHASKVYNFPLNAADSIFMGGGPKIRQELDQGVVLANYYGHGGGYQWDLIFTNDDIDLLQNNGRLPVIFSVTCYTAHFDDQNVFGEQFNKLPDRGSIGFFGNTVLTYWGIGNAIDEKIYAEIFNNRDYIIGKAILNAKNNVPASGLYGQQITLLTYLGDPGMKLALPDKPDFVITASDISISKTNPLVNDTIQIKAKINNLGTTFPDDTINVQVFASTTDTSYLVTTNRMSNFGEEDSIIVNWIPNKSALYNIQVKVNELNPIPENDHSDNIASTSFAVYDLSEANVLYPQDGYSTSENIIKFRFIDIGYYINLSLKYFIEIDTSTSFQSPILSSSEILPTEGLLNWNSPQLSEGAYFWRVRILNGTSYGEWSKIRAFIVLSQSKPGFYSADKELTLFNNYNLNYSDSLKSLKLNTSIIPPRPSKTTFIDDISLNTPIVDTVHLTSITTDGTYIYVANIWYYAGYSKIYKFGTGYNGTVKGEFYGSLPIFYDRVANSMMFHSDGFLYVTTPDPYHIKKVNPVTGDTSSIFIPSGLLNAETGRPTPGIFYLKSDGEYFYNLTVADTLGNRKYVLRVLDPLNNWQLHRPDMELESSSYAAFTDFFIADGYLYPTEINYHNLMRRIRISDGYFEDEWEVYTPWQSYYAWCYDPIHDIEIASVFGATGGNFTPKFSQFEGRHVDANGNFTTQDVGPASKWNNLTYDFIQNNSGSFSNVLYGLNKVTKNYDTLAINIPQNYSLQNVSSLNYKYLKLFFKMTDTTFNIGNPMQFKSLNIDYDGLPEIMIAKNDLSVSPDSVLQGLKTKMHFNVTNIGFVPANNVTLKFYLNNSDSSFYNSTVDLKPDSSKSLDYIISTAPLIFQNKIKAIADYPNSEYFTFNNIMEHSFFVARDSTSPTFNITFDGKEILDGDIVSSRPEIKITLKDNSPLSMDTSLFTIIFDNIPLDFTRNDVRFDTTGYPNAEAILTWKTAYPFPDGKHTLEVLAKDPSGNFFDTTSYRINFYVYTEYDLKQVYNYPNPFKDGTYFTFIVTGDKLPDQLYLKIYTVAGRLIRTINITSSELGTDLGFKRIYWDGKDEDGDEIANGVYFYKMIYKVKDVVRTVTQKLAKVK